MASKKPAAKKAAKKAAKPVVKNAAAKKADKRVKEQHFLPPWVVIGKPIKAAILGAGAGLKDYTVAYFDAPSGWVELSFEAAGAKLFHRTHFNNIALEAASAP
jgi:hypothetical protein